MAGNIFSDHPRDLGETYGEHFGNASRFGLRLIGGGLACLVHAFLPFLFVNKGSEMVREMHKSLAQRAEKPNWERHPII